MIELDYGLINDRALMDGMSVSERYAALSLEKLRNATLRQRVTDFFAGAPRRVVLVTAVKNEARNLVEWIAYHRLLGIDGFVIFDNDSDDATPDILEALHHSGIACSVPWPTVHPYEKQQISAFANAVRALQGARAGDWVGFLDLDEYYAARNSTSTIPDLLETLPEAEALHLTWLFYGSGGAEAREAGPMIERFTRRGAFSHPKNWQGKPLARLGAVVGHYHHPHNLKVAHPDRYLLPDGTVFPRVLPNRQDDIAQDLFKAKVRSAEILCVHHYAVRSREEFMEKQQKGRINYRVSEAKKEMLEHERYFRSLDLNDEEDTFMLQFVPGLKAEAARLVETAGLAHMLPG